MYVQVTGTGTSTNFEGRFSNKNVQTTLVYSLCVLNSGFFQYLERFVH